MMPRPSRTSFATCSPTRWPLPTHHNGSTPDSTGPTGSPAHPKDCGTSMTRPRNSYPPLTPTADPLLMPATYSASAMTWSTRVESWTCGCGRLASSSSAPAPDPTSPPSEGRTNCSLVVASPPGSCPSSRSGTAPPARSSRVAPPVAQPRWSFSMSTIPTSRSSSTGRRSRKRRPSCSSTTVASRPISMVRLMPLSRGRTPTTRSASATTSSRPWSKTITGT